jgi:hypothetical protein
VRRESSAGKGKGGNYRIGRAALGKVGDLGAEEAEKAVI